ncbi:transient receptor potential channel pyrexia-like [Clytia hemisphaerica]
MIIKERRFRKRKDIQALQYRQGPSSLDDEKSFFGHSKKQDDSPKGLDELVPHTPHKVDLITELAGSEVLIVYFAKLGASHQDSMIDLDYLETLIESGAKVNYTDRYGQTVLHEIVLRWPLDVAEFMLQHGADLNMGDDFGRTPLHVAASVNSAEYINWLVSNGADVHARTLKEEQTPIHYASKYNSCDSITALIDLGAKLNDRDHKQRTPLQVGAETGREEACRLLMEYDAPAGVYDDTGTTCLAHMIEKMPDVAAEALEQFQKVDKASRTVRYYLSYLETEKWNMLRAKKNPTGGWRELTKREPLEAIIKHNESRLIMHPVIQRLLAKKSELYGRRYFLSNLLINFVFTLIWTALTIGLPGPEKVENTSKKLSFYRPVSENMWRIILEIIGLLMVIYFVLKIRIEASLLSKNFNSYKLSRSQEIKRDLPYCHPRWPQEGKFINGELKKITSTPLASIYDIWYYMDCLSFLGLVILVISRAIIVEADFATEKDLYFRTLSFHYHAYPFVLILIWLRFMQAFRPFITLGPFIAMLGYVASDTMKFAFLFCEFYVPYCCAIWIVFGNVPGNSFEHFNDLLFEVLRMTVVDSFDFDALTSQNKLVAQLICGTYLALTSITCLNLYIALLSETFSRVFGNATATAYMLQGEALISVEKKMNQSKRKAIQLFIAEQCSPETVYGVGGETSDEARDIMSEMDNLKRQCDAIKKLQQDMKSRATFFKIEAMGILSQQNEIMEDLEETVQAMTTE